MELFLDVLSETLVDTAKMLPFLFLAYLFIEYVETRHGERIEALLAGGGRWGAVPGAVLGCVPQCGFSAIASNFYASRVITLGTLMAVYLATSDEAIPPQLNRHHSHQHGGSAALRLWRTHGQLRDDRQGHQTAGGFAG